METIDKLLALYDNKAECARALGITPQRLNTWIKQGFIPYKNGDLIQDKTKGRIKASLVWQSASAKRMY
jgi:hypothetical protein